MPGDLNTRAMSPIYPRAMILPCATVEWSR